MVLYTYIHELLPLNSVPQSSLLVPAVSMLYKIANAKFNQPKGKLSGHEQKVQVQLF